MAEVSELEQQRIRATVAFKMQYYPTLRKYIQMDYTLTKNKYKTNNYKPILIPFLIGIAIICFLVSLSLVGIHSKSLGTEVLGLITDATSNPFIGLFIGLLATAILQSSSTTTATVVAFVASGTISLQNAIPIVLGANVGTTITSFIVALSHITKKNEFRKATATASAHSLFNIFTILLVLPIQYYSNFLATTSTTLARWILDGPLALIELNTFKNLISFFATAFNKIIPIAGLPALILSFILLYSAIISLNYLIKTMMISGAKKRIESLFFGNKFKALSWGTTLTAIMQSSSLVCSILVPIVATGKTTLKKAFPVILGANIGTTFTALVAAFSNSQAAVSIALVHVIFNLIGVVIVFIFPKLSEGIIYLSRLLGQATVKNRLIGFAYMLIVFFMIPFLLILFNKNAGKESYVPNTEIQDSLTNKTIDNK